ncbi:hypothetical protein [Aridibaculum aurantiacum]|uniref:hypothetical protein n=1 Tax=Aridibaculum aurantiacum TaxID=2810307 RepID=UPI001A970B2C|nr:hypothetical protein [Aridibaculum aurantiacum]
MATDNENRQGQGGTGGAEQTGGNRDEQKSPLASIDEGQKQDIANQAGVDENMIADVADTGALSGRDDASGGTGEGMENTSSNEGTDRM